MRHYRRKRYENKTAKKVFFRIFFVLMAAVVITVIATLIGHRVKEMVEEAERKIDAVETSWDETEDNGGKGHYIAGVFETPVTVSAFAVDPLAETELAPLLNDIKSDFDTIAVNLTKDGTLIYLSPARLSFIGLPEVTQLPDGTGEGYENLKTFGSIVKTENFRMCAVMEATRAGERGEGTLLPDADKAMFPELLGLGFDEVIFTGLSPLTDEDVDYLSALVNDMMPIGVLLSYEDYIDQRNEKRLRLLSAAGVLLCVDPGTEGETDIAEATAERCAALRNAESVYHLRYVLTSGDASVLREQYAVLSAWDAKRKMILTPIAPAALTDETAEEETTGEDTMPEKETEVPVNPYATTTSNGVQPDEKGETGSEGEVYRGDGSWY